MKTDKTPRDVLERLVDRALTYRYCGVDSMTRDGKSRAKVGEIVQSASLEERTLLSELTSDDAASFRSDLDEIKYNETKKHPNYYVKPK